MEYTANFKVEGRIAQLLGQNYSSVEHALKELIDNAWDADAENVYITMPKGLNPDEQYISIQDDGVGMSESNIKNEYMHIARNRISFGGETTKIKHRKVKGRKGIGKFAGLLIANYMSVTTTKEGITTTFEIKKDNFIEETNDISSQNIPLTIKNDQDKNNGTEIILNELDILSITPDDYKLKQLLVLEYDREKDFSIYINGEILKVEDVGGKNYKSQMDFGENKVAYLDFNIADKEIRNKKSGIVLRVEGKIIGKPHYWGVEEINYVQSKLLRKVYGEVKADYLLPYTTNSWGILESTVDYSELEVFVKEQLLHSLEDKFEAILEYNKKRIQREIDKQLKDLPEHKREKAVKMIDKVLRGLSDGRHSEEQIKNIISVVISAIDSDDYYSIVEKLANANDSDIGLFAEMLEEFGLIDIALIINQAVARRTFLDKMQELSDNPKTLEQEIHKALEKNMWVFGKAYSLMASNQSTKHIIDKYFSEKFKGNHAKKRPDLLLSQDNANRYLLIEFKRPTIKIDRTHETQAVQYRDDLQTRFHNAAIDIMVIGKSVDPKISPHQTQNNLVLSSYDAIIANARNELEWLINNLEQR